MQALRGSGLAMIFQEPMTSLNPAFTIGAQIVEGLRCHHPRMTRTQAEARALQMLERVRIPAPEQRLHEHPHRLSGGMRQRAMIAMALANGPRLLIADEPTTALDVTIQAQILELMHTLQRDSGTAIMLITHDLGVVAEVAEVADEVAVMYCGRIVVVSVSISLLLGVPIGLAAGCIGGGVDALISRITDAFLACPFLILAIAMAAFLGPSLSNAMIAIGISPPRDQ